MKQIHVRMDEELYKELNDYSANANLSVQDCVREAVASYVTDIKKNIRQ